MAEKRMFSRKLISSDAFLDLPLTAQGLFFHLCMRADDDGFVDSPKKIMREVQAKQKDFDALKDKRYILVFDSGVVLIKHWFIHNTIAKDRYTPTIYTDERSKVMLKCGKPYTECKPSDNKSYTECKRFGDKTEPRIDKNRKENDREGDSAPTCDTFNVEQAWIDTFAIYPKKSAAVMAKQVWMDKLLPVIEENRKDVAMLIYRATKMYLDDYDKNNPDDENHRYIPKYSDWLVNDCDYWISEVEKSQRGDDS